MINGIAADILERAAGGDIGAFEEVYKATSGFVYNVALKVTRNSADADEVTQDVFMKIYHGLKDFKFRSSFKTWVYRITVNTAINSYRKQARERTGRVEFDDVIERLPDNRTAADVAINNDDRARLKSLLEMLRPEFKVCLIMREVEGLSYEEIAKVLMIPVNTVRSRLSRAREALLGEARKGLVKDG